MKYNDNQASQAVVDSTQEYTRIRFKELGFRLLSNWYVILGVALLASIAMGVFTFYFVTPVYKASTTFYVLDTKQGTAMTYSELQAGEALTEDYIKVFSMWEVHDQVRKELGLSYSYQQMGKMVSVSQAQGSRMLDITVSSPDAEEAAAMANKYAEVSTKFISEKMKTDKPCIVSTARIPTAPAGPNAVRNILLSFMVGIVLAASFVVLRVIFDDKIKTAEDIERYTGLPTLAVVPLQNKKWD